MTNCPGGGDALDLVDSLHVPGGQQVPYVDPSSGYAIAPEVTADAPVVRCFNVLLFCVDDTEVVVPVVGTDPITIEDLASFSPEAGELVVQPDGWGIEGQETNLYVTAEDHAQDGELLGEQVEVAWTVVEVTFDYGDGTVVTAAGGGAPWAEGEELEATATSHVYAERGEYTASATVVFAAEVRVGGDWVAVPGTITVTPEPVDLRIYRVDTVLVRGDCIQYPADPGCPDWEPPE